MKHTKSLLILLCTLTATLTAGSSARAQCADTESGFAGGDGSCGNPFQICNANQLNLMRLRANAHYVLIDDIDLSNGEAAEDPTATHNWDPIRFKTVIEELGFNGTLDGQGFAIIGMRIDQPNDSYAALFGRLAENAAVVNLRMVDAAVRCGVEGGNEKFIGAIAGQNDGLIQNVVVDGEIIGRGLTGGLAGEITSTGRIINCRFSGSVDTFSVGDVGGIVGINAGLIQRADVDATLYGASDVGGIAGNNEDGGVIELCSSTGVVTGHSARIGGLVGNALENSLVRNCVSRCDVFGDLALGGLLGWSRYSTIETSYATGSIDPSSLEYFGGMIGGVELDSTVTDILWDKNTSGTDVGVFHFSQDQAILGEFGYPTSMLQQQATYPASWDFDDVWAIDEGNDYPQLRNGFESNPANASSLDICDPTVQYVDELDDEVNDDDDNEDDSFDPPGPPVPGTIDPVFVVDGTNGEVIDDGNQDVTDDNNQDAEETDENASLVPTSACGANGVIIPSGMFLWCCSCLRRRRK